MKTLIVIPARGGSKRIPRKNIRQMCGQPLIAYVVRNAKAFAAKHPAHIVLSTDDEELIQLAARYDIEVLQRSEALCRDATTLDPVVLDAVQQMEAKHGGTYEYVLTLQPTSPTLQPESLCAAFEQMVAEDRDSMISAVNHPHLSWQRSGDGFAPLYSQRLNSQYLPDHFQETGGFLMTKRRFITETGRLGSNISIYELDARQAVDIDTEEDWAVARSILRRKRILLRVDGGEMLGMGHIYRCLSLAYKLMGHDLLFVTAGSEEMELGRKRLEESNFPVGTLAEGQSFYKLAAEWEPNVLINDILDTTQEYMAQLQKLGCRLVNFEDLGTGAPLADAVINALYETDAPAENVYCGRDYFFIRDEFLETPPSEFSEQVRNVLVMFGGSDPSNLTGRLFEICRGLHGQYPEIQFHIITGFGYLFKNQLHSDEAHNIFVHKDVKRVSHYMQQADLAVTSQGRVIYELAAMGVPALILAQNRRELEHSFAQVKNGFINLGLGSAQQDTTVANTMRWLIDTPQLRSEMHDLQLASELKRGQKRVIDLILGE